MQNRIEALAEKVEALRAEITELDAVTEPSEEQAARFDAALAEFDTAKADYDAAIERAAKVEAVRTASVEGRVERAFHAPQVHVKRDVFSEMDSVVRGYASDEDMIARALT